MKFGHLEPGLVVYDVGRSKMGNTSVSTVSVWHVTIVSTDEDTQSVMASWNGNAPRRFYKHTWQKWRLKYPVLVSVGWGKRLATREELKAMKAEATQPARDATA